MATQKTKDAIALLKEDHERVSALLGKLAETTERASKTRRELFEKIRMELEIHARIEEEIFYPAFKEAAKKKDDQDLFYEAKEEHHLVREIELPEMSSTEFESPEFSAKAKVLKELVEHHVHEEESAMFPRARKLFSKGELAELGVKLEERQAELMRQGKAA